MVDFKALLPGHKQTEKQGGSSYTHPLGRTTDQHTNPEHGVSGAGGKTGAYPRPADNAFEWDSQPQGGTGQGGDASMTHGSSAAPNVAENAAYRQDMPLTAGGAQDRAAMHHAGGGESGASSTRNAEDIAVAKQAHLADGGANFGHATRRQGATGLETRDPYAAAAQAGALPDKNDISNIDREVAAGGGAGAGFGSQQQTSTLGAVGGDRGPYSSSGQRENQTPARGLNAGVSDPVAVTGAAPVSEPIHQDPGLMGASSGKGAWSALPGQSAGSGNGQEGLIHGHHTTLTGEKLDPHLSSGRK